MIKQTPGKIFLADQRGLTETSRFRRYSTFSFGPYAHEHKTAFGPLYAVNEETLGGGQTLEFGAEQAAYLVLLPVTGEVLVSGAAGAVAAVGVEEVQVLTLPAGSTVRLTNPYATELVTFLHVWLHAAPAGVPAASHTFGFALPALTNQLAEVVAARQPDCQLPFAVRLGCFAGRHEVLHPVPANASLFAYVLAGAFEAEGRLLHEKDGLALWNSEAVELEALSNNALILVLELQAGGFPVGV